MRLFVCGEEDVAQVLAAERIGYVFSIGDTGVELPGLQEALRAVPHTRWQFDDVVRNMFGYQCLTVSQAGALADEIRRVVPKYESILVHCAAGISRSSAVAAALLAHKGMRVAAGLRETWIRSRPYRGDEMFRPNPSVLELLDHALGLNGTLSAYKGSSFYGG